MPAETLTGLLGAEVIQWVSRGVGVQQGDLEADVLKHAVDLPFLTGVAVRVHQVPRLRRGLMRDSLVLLLFAQSN